MRYVLLYDIDGTLLDAGGAGRAAMEAVLREDLGVAGGTADVPMAGRTDVAIIGDVLRHNGVPAGRETDFREAYLRRLPQALESSGSRLLPGANASVATATGLADVGVGLLTGNLQKAADAKLRHHDLDRSFSFGSFGDQSADRNDLALHAASRMATDGGPPPERVWVIGDTPADIACARAAGFRVAAVETGGYDASRLAEHEPDLILSSLAESGRLFAELT